MPTLIDSSDWLDCFLKNGRDFGFKGDNAFYTGTYSSLKPEWAFSLDAPEWAFKPDLWSVVFLRGLTRISDDWNHKRIWEVGVGTGLNVMILRKLTEGCHWFLSDYDARCVPLAEENLSRFPYTLDKSHGKAPHTLHPLKGSWDLVTPPSDSEHEAPKVDVVFGCLPQVPAHIDRPTGDWIAHYYDPERYPKAHLNALGLGLVETLLVDAKKILRTGGQVVLNLSGRPGLDRLKSLFNKNGYRLRNLTGYYRPEGVIWTQGISQHPGTSLASLAALEKSGHKDFEFFADFELWEPINAGEAEERRIAGEKVYHKIYVMAGTLA
ncbi:MAG: hypothetical protein COV91_04155 [Candidatus Taylorbacteria bacterium CG11_big_fil_rev_8_21_14_0_20_46_11]|uniref:Uncharacterized protein n=1 Tax=Candidatus Taylorbacteria bacterium CG11_big_fil_rev_8_21_14_0_20_46_11 TaxID=1975025 RepID=A0A2H0KAZ2_9BACT|nr:MAG: hypothetical protein COV91_04155 [Candidatus Taylorbacteria bacterium CG11_big_fil_rev_8_21_14_0_20_46_11]